MNDIIPPKNNRGQLPTADRQAVPVRPRVGYDTLYVNRHTVSEPANDSEPTVTTDETIVVSPDPDIAIRMAALLVEEDIAKEAAQSATFAAESLETPIVVEDESILESVVDDIQSDTDDVQADATETESEPAETVVIIETISKHGVPELPIDKKVAAMTQALEKARKDLDREHRKRFALKRVTLGLIGMVLLLATGYVGVDTLMANNKVKADTQVTAANDSPNAVPDPSQEGKDTSPLPVNALANYQVASNLPRAIYIDKVNVAARLLHMNVNADGSVQAPRNIFDAGWYTGSVKPGEPGAMFVDGHSSGSSHMGLFGNLDKLVIGDTLQVEKGDGTRLVYQVVFKETVKLAEVDMKKALKPYGGAAKGLNLMTCAGGWTSDNTTMTERTIVYTQQI